MCVNGAPKGIKVPFTKPDNNSTQYVEGTTAGGENVKKNRAQFMSV